MVKTQGRSSGTNAFTLVELLVVVGIISVLVSILLPGLARAREHAARIKCTSNLHQIAMAAIMYANENRGRFPRTYHLAGAGLANTCQGGKGHNPTDNPFSIAKPSAPVGTNSCGASLYLLVKSHAVPPEVFHCPSNSVAQTMDAGDVDLYSNFPTPMRVYNSYSYAAWFPTKTALAGGWKSDVTLSPDYPLAADINPGKGGNTFDGSPASQDVTSVAYFDSAKDMARANSNNHRNQGQNVVYVDGHVEWSPTPFCGPQAPGRVWRDNIYCNTNGVDPVTGKGGTVHAPPQNMFDVVLHPGDGAE